MDEKTLKQEIERIVEEIMLKAYCYYCCQRNTVCFDFDHAEEVILKLFLELTKE